jgi:hypothetical protein
MAPKAAPRKSPSSARTISTDGCAGEKPEDRHPHSGHEYPQPDRYDQRRKDRGSHRASERAHQIASDESGDQSIDTRNKEECERERTTIHTVPMTMLAW